MYLSWQNTFRTSVSSLFLTPTTKTKENKLQNKTKKQKKQQINETIRKFSRLAWSLKFHIK